MFGYQEKIGMQQYLLDGDTDGVNMIPKFTRRFNGIEFQPEKSFSSKVAARSFAKDIRKKGYLARVVNEEGGWYKVYRGW